MAQPGSHRAKDRLLALGRRYPNLWHLVDRVRAANADAIGTADWPAYTFLPLEHAAAVAVELLRAEGRTPAAPSQLAYVATDIATLAAWRMTQGIYRFDPVLYEALATTPINGEIPAQLLQRLPEWCVYIETPGMRVATTDGSAPLHGAYAWIDHHQSEKHDLLVLALDAGDLPLTVTHVPLLGTLEQACAATLAEWQSAYVRGNVTRPPPPGWAEHMRKTVPPLLSLILYLCSDAPDITRRGRLDQQPGNPRPVRTRRAGWRLFPASGPAEWNVGVRLGAALRAAYEREKKAGEDALGGRQLRPHIRRAHWHTFLSGARRRPDGGEVPSMERRRALRWLPPIAVKVSDLDALPAVVKPVR